MKITKDDLFCDIAERTPAAIAIFMMYGIRAAQTPLENHTIEDVAACFGVNLDSLLKTLNQFVNSYGKA